MKIIFVLLISLLIGCNKSIIDSKKINKNFEGELLYKSKCGGCHKLYDKFAYNQTQWTSILLEMEKKSRISFEQKNKIYDYLIDSTQENLSN